jgi:hypothetical protein
MELSASVANSAVKFLHMSPIAGRFILPFACATLQPISSQHLARRLAISLAAN